VDDRSIKAVSFLLIAVFSGLLSAQTNPAHPPDVILITIDTLRADHVGCFGAKPSPTPNIDRLCTESTRYAQAVTPSPITTPSHVSIMTGLYPSHHGVADFGMPLDAEHKTLAEILKSNGYRTAAFIGAVVVDGSSLAPGLDRGFDFFDHFPKKAKGHWDVVERRGEVVMQHAISWLLRNLQSPRFVWVHLYDPHDPYEAPKPFARKTETEYDDEVTYADAQVGKLVALLKTQRRYDDSLIVVMSDHGEGLGEHKEETHGVFLYDSTLRIPLLVKWSGKTQSKANLEQVSSVDVMPTILEAVQAQLPEGIDGRPLQRAGELPKVRLAETDYPVRFGWAPLRAARTVDHKYIDAPRPEFFELKSDPHERENAYQPWLDVVQQLRAQVAEARAKSSAATPSSVPQSTVDELKALGYLGNVVGATTAADLTTLPDPKDKIEVQNALHDGMMQADRGEHERAIESFERALKLDDRSPVVLSQLGEAELKAGMAENAVKHLQRAKELSPGDSNLSLLLGRALSQSGKLQEAAREMEAGLKAAPNSYEARVALAEVYSKLKNESAAVDQLEASILSEPDRAEARVALAKIFLAAGKKNAATEQLRRVLRDDPSNREVKRLLAR
jgi:choline-sulfatase